MSKALPGKNGNQWGGHLGTQHLWAYRFRSTSPLTCTLKTQEYNRTLTTMSTKPAINIRTLIRILILLIGVILCVRACATYQEDQRQENHRRTLEHQKFQKAYDDLGEAIRKKHAANKDATPDTP